MTTSPDTAAPAARIPREAITGLVLAGGRATRMGGVDKGLQNHRGIPLALHAVMRLALQVGEMMVNANRNLAAYESFGVPVWPDVMPDFPGPLAGLMTGLERCETAWLATVPCDSPDFPEDLVARLAAAAVREDAEIAVAACPDAERGGAMRPQPVFMLVRADLSESLVRFLHEGERKVDRWTARHRTVVVPFDDAAAFFNANTPEELRALQAPRG